MSVLRTIALDPAVQLGRRVDRRARRALSGPGRWAVLSAVDAVLAALDSALPSPLAQEVGDRIRESSLPDLLEPLIAAAIDSPEAERLVGQILDSRVIDVAVRQLLETEALWQAVDEIAQSPAVTEAIGRQGISFADQMAGVVRQSSRHADDRIERLAWRLARRGPRTPAQDGGGSESEG